MFKEITCLISFNQDDGKRELYFRYFVLLMINLIKRWIMKTWKVEAAIIAVGMVLLGVIINGV